MKRSLFVEMDGRPEYLLVNPQYATKYFDGFVPSVAYNPFKQRKDKNSFRVVALGGSSAAGFPYQFYYGFPEALAKRLAVWASGQQIEVINLGMTAINSYSIWDIREEVLDIEPDAIVVYAGHNEFYGAFGAGSAISRLGNRIWLKRTVLRLKKWVLYLMLEDLLTSRSDPGNIAVANDDRTLMSRVVRDASIEFDDATYRAGVEQFDANMSEVVDAAVDRGIPVFMGTLVSNLSGLPPLGSNPDASAAFEQGQAALSTDADKADSLLTLARDLDNIRFRAPSEINEIIERIARREGVTLVDIRLPFKHASTLGVPGYDLFVDHLHPTVAGYDLLGDAFFQAITQTPGLRHNEGTWMWKAQLDPFAASQSAILIERLLSDFPFETGKTPDEISRQSDALIRRYLTSGLLADSLAAISLGEGVSIQNMLYEGLTKSKARSDTSSTLRYYQALFYWQPFNMAFRQEGVSYALNQAQFDSLTLPLAALGTRMGETAFFWNALAAILLRSADVKGADVALEQSERLDAKSPTFLYNRARYYIMIGDTASARGYFERFQQTQQQ